MNFLSALIVLMVAVGVYSNCGCLKCNKNLNVYSPRGSCVKFIYKHSPCSCHTSLPYSVQVPVQQHIPCGGRCYGYHVQEPQVQPEPICPIPHEYNVQLQVPVSKPNPSYLLGLVAKTDRVLISGPAEPQPAPGCPRPIIEPIQVAQDNDGDVSDDIWYYSGRRQSGCGCLRYDQKISNIQHRKPPNIAFSAPHLNLQLLQRHSYTPPKSKVNINSELNYKAAEPSFRNTPDEDFYRVSITELLNRSISPKTAIIIENSERLEDEPNKSDLICRKGVQFVQIIPGLIRIYRQVFCKPTQKNVELWNRIGNEQNSAPVLSNRFPESYQQVFLRSKPRSFRNSSKLFRGSSNNSQLSNQITHRSFLHLNRNMINEKQIEGNSNSEFKDKKTDRSFTMQPTIYNNFDYVLNSKPLSYGGKFRKTDHNSDIKLTQNLSSNGNIQNIYMKMSDTPTFQANSQRKIDFENEQTGGGGDTNKTPYSKQPLLNVEQNPSNLQNANINPSFTNRENFQNSAFETKSRHGSMPIEQIRRNFTVKIFHKKPSRNFSQNQPENFSKLKKVQEKPISLNVDIDSQQKFQNLHQSSNDTNNLTIAVPKKVHIVKSHQLLLTTGNSGTNTMFLSTTHKFSGISDSLLSETMNSIVPKGRNRLKRSINWKLLALKPENPPRYLRAHNYSPRGFVNQKNEEEMFKSMPKLSLRERLRALHSHKENGGGTYFGHGVNPSVHDINPFAYGGRHSPFGIKSPMHSGGHSAYGVKPFVRSGGHLKSSVLDRRHQGHVIKPSAVGGRSVHGRKPLSITKRSSRLPKTNKKKVQLKKKKNNAILKSTWKRANKIIKDWFSKGSPPSPPEIQLPTYESSNTKKLKLKPIIRKKRRVRDDGLLPFLSFLDDTEKRNKRPAKNSRGAETDQNSKPTDEFLQPLNFDHIFHPTPILHLLNTPIRCLNHFHKLKSHVSPVVGTIPKVIQVSRRYVVGLLRNLGKNAIHLGTHFVKGFTNLKKSNLMPKKRFRRNANSNKYIWDDYSKSYGHDEEISPFYSYDEPTTKTEEHESEASQWEFEEVNDKKYVNRYDEWKNTNDDKEEINNEHIQYRKTKTKPWDRKEEIGEQTEDRDFVNGHAPNDDESLRRFLNQEEIQDMFAKRGEQKCENCKHVERDRYSYPEYLFNSHRRKRDVEEATTKTEEPKQRDGMLMTLVRMLFGLGTNERKKDPEDEQHQNEDNYSNKSAGSEEVVTNNPPYKETKWKKGYPGDDSEEPSVKPEVFLLNSNLNLKQKETIYNHPDTSWSLDHDSANTAVGTKDRRERGTGEVYNKEIITKNDKENVPADLVTGWKALVDLSGDAEAIPDIVIVDEAPNLELDHNKAKLDMGLVSNVKTLPSSKRKREVGDKSISISSKRVRKYKPEMFEDFSFGQVSRIKEDHKRKESLTFIKNKMQIITEEVNKMLAPQSLNPSHLSELDVQVQTIKNKLVKILSNIKTLINHDFSKDLHVYQGLFKLQDIESNIIQKWKALIIENNPTDVLAKKNDLLVEVKEAKDLKELMFRELAQRISDQESFLAGNWIKILVRLQKFHCVVKKLHQKLEDHDFNIDVLENLDLVGNNNRKEILANLQRNQDAKLEAQIQLVENLILILSRRDNEKIREEAKTIWEINNVEKLQKVSILELNQKISRGLKVRKELKILFDLQAQLEKCEQKQKSVMEDLGGDNGSPTTEGKVFYGDKQLEICFRRKRKFIIINE